MPSLCCLILYCLILFLLFLLPGSVFAVSVSRPFSVRAGTAPERCAQLHEASTCIARSLREIIAVPADGKPPVINRIRCLLMRLHMNQNPPDVSLICLRVNFLKKTSDTMFLCIIRSSHCSNSILRGSFSGAESSSRSMQESRNCSRAPSELHRLLSPP